MAHDKIKAAARRRMAETGESYAAARLQGGRAARVRSPGRPVLAADRGTIGVHARGGSWLANGSPDGLVEITIDPPCRTERSLSTFFRRAPVDELVVSLVDPDGFIAAVRPPAPNPR
jgi:hypothetical protein